MSDAPSSPNHLSVTRHLWAHDNRRFPHSPGAGVSPRGSRRAYSTSNNCLLSLPGADDSPGTGPIDRDTTTAFSFSSSPIAPGSGAKGDPGALVGGGAPGATLHHRRRRLILKAVNRSWPTSGSGSSSATSGCYLVAGGRLRNGLAPSPTRSPSEVASSPGGGGGGRLLNPVLKSFLYKSDSEYDMSPRSLSYNSSLNANDGFMDDVIVTPFAQILQCLRNVWTNYMLLTNIPTNKSKRAIIAAAKDRESNPLQQSPIPEDQYQRVAMETLNELEWCLEQLELSQSDRSVSDLATNKFKRMLNRELSHLAETSKTGNEISEYICNTFLDKQLDLPSFRVEEFDSAEESSWRSQRTKHHHPIMSHISGVRQFRTRNSFVGVIPTYGVDSVTADLPACMANINNWGVDVFRIAEATNQRPLTAMVYTIIQERGLTKTLRISSHSLVAYLSQVESHYGTQLPYHNSIHAADVAQTAHYMLLQPTLENIFTDIETFAVLFAGAIHDVDHPGLSNQYLINTGSELALMYNDESVLENHHLAIAFKLLQTEGCDVLAEFTPKQRQLFRRMVIDMVLATDMTRHLDHLAHLKTMVETRKISGNCEISMENYCERIQVLQCLVHCSDLSNPAKPLDLYRQWTDRITEEFFRQGDLEREKGLDVSPMCDRSNANVGKSQIGFIDYIVQPLWEAWSELVYPDSQFVLDALDRNRAWYSDRISDSPPEVESHNADDDDADVTTTTTNATLTSTPSPSNGRFVYDRTRAFDDCRNALTSLSSSLSDVTNGLV